MPFCAEGDYAAAPSWRRRRISTSSARAGRVQTARAGTWPDLETRVQRRFRLTRSEDFEHARRAGRSFPHRLLVLIVTANEREYSRVGFVAGRAVGNAVQRNRAKRLLREVMRNALTLVSPGWDVVLIARSPLASSGLNQAREAVDTLLHRAGLVRAS